MTLVVDADIHRLKDERHVLLFRDGRDPFQSGDDVLVHLGLCLTGLIVATDDRHQLAPQLLRHAAAISNGNLESVVILRIVQTGPKPPSGELRHFKFQLVGQFRDCIEVLVLMGPELDRRIAEFGGHLNPLEKRQFPPPHLDVHGKSCVGRFAKCAGV